MRALISAALLCAVLAGQAEASTYSTFNAGIAAANRGDIDQSIQLLTAAIAAPDLSPQLLPTAYFLRGDLYAIKNQCDQAIADFSAGLKLEPDEFAAHLDRASCYAYENKIDQALSDMTSAITARPDLAKGYASRGVEYVVLGKFDSAIADFTSAAAIAPYDYGILQSRGGAYLGEAMYDQALADENKAIDLNSNYWPSYYTRGMIYDDLGKFNDALNEYKHVLDLSPDNVAASQSIGLTQWEIGRFDEAEKIFADSIKSQPQNIYLTLWLDFARAKAAKPDDDLAQRAAKLDLTKWPGPLVNVFLGKITPDQAFQAAAIGTASVAHNHKCDADFYVGEWRLQHQNSAAAKPLLADAAAGCRNDSWEWRGANTELKRLP
ncbi:MAG: tetratricopeptide repeat protein [Rhizomicrobium sp.]|jgi:tetratricopeptide (TPR) repeat protein